MSGNDLQRNTNIEIEQRETFNSKYGFILACIGSAMGLANIWMFPWRLGAYGGAAFLIPYLIFLYGFSTFGLMGEFAFGRKMRKGPVGAFEKAFKSKGKKHGAKVGAIPVIGLTGVLTFYCVVIGWILKYFTLAVMGQFRTMDVDNYFTVFSASSSAIPWNMAGIIITGLIVSLGIQNGIEKANKYMMTTFYIVVFIIMFRALTLPGAMEGVKFLLVPKWEELFHIKTWIMALGMTFFTLSLGGAGMVIYGSYLKDGEDVPDITRKTAIFDLLASLMSALFTIPAAFAFGLDPGAGPKLLFMTLPKVFNSMPGGYIFGILFFMCVVFAAISSSINMIEVPVEALIDRLKFSRSKSILVICIICAAIGAPLNLDAALFGKFADLFSVQIFPCGAILCAITMYWIYGADKAREDINAGAVKPLGKWFEPFMKYVFTPVSAIIVFAGFVLGGF
ncbi:NSS family neurotransmitter:Na+ symporter [Clostridium tetanomorphum]|uniref:sodium-dependent transporter n=1 Tax=Clostridium tetanomorphum TaxID=1553 RepID=UPI0004497217|nr:sodium-dependent transporter [Clostridium tetanomorphum]KAJ49960.1 sodium:neurotransmitter symporter [Clostridium tetanomorphum DSM 665]MBP1866090.1 NSS family neurotransmitter:Na+ symporter [Clostridium tetanomorphum]NRS86718.1 NSS family neurotransmitter:Na+ symporter [Clostridium tetanomorphum]SQC00493.1 sodium-dependent amino acid transporter [Clostridium tetanomorphum]